jgi:hypothetical protein
MHCFPYAFQSIALPLLGLDVTGLPPSWVRPAFLKLGAAASQGAMKLKSESPEIRQYLKKLFFTLLICSKN